MNYRKNKVIGKPKKRKPPINILLFDTETNSKPNKDGIVNFTFKLGAAIHVTLDNKGKVKNRYTYKLTSQDDFIDIIRTAQNHNGAVYIYAHNIGFDIRVLDLPDKFAKLKWISKPPIINNRVFLWSVENDRGKIHFVDTANYGVSTVDNLGRDMGIKKLDIDFETGTEDELYIYCLRDVEVIERFIIEYLTFLNTYKLGAYALTIASQSMSAYRHKFLMNDIHIHTKNEAIELERKAYYGGRVEALYIGKKTGEDYYYLDYNSMYPYVMKNYKVPVKLKGYTTETPVNYLKARLSRSYCIARVLIETDEPAYPLRSKSKLIFPVGKFVTTLHDIELRHAIKNNHIKAVYECAVYDAEYIFTKYVDFFYSLKERFTVENNRSWRFITKLFLNSLYGKWGQINTVRKEIGECDYNLTWRLPMHNVETGEYFTEFAWCGKIYREIKGGETSFSFPAIAGAVTAYARYTLFSALSKAGRENTIYMDTDSLVVNKHGLNNLKDMMSETSLGGLKIEQQSNSVEIFGAKDYVFGGKAKKKGVPRSAEQIGKNSWRYLQFQGMITWLNGGAKGHPTGKYTVKSRKSKYDKGIVSSNGIVHPLVVQHTDLTEQA